MSEEAGAAAAQVNTGSAAVQTPPTTESAPPPVMAESAPEGAKPEGAMPAPVMAEAKPAEAKPAEAKPGDGETPPAAEPKPEEPIDYFAEAKLPEGYTLDQELVPKAAELFGKYKLPKEAAQEFIDFAAAMRGREAQQAAQTAQAQQIESVRKMAAEITSRPEYEKERPLVQLGIRNLAKDFPEIRAFYNDPVFGSMPELWKIALAVGRRFETEAQLLSGGKDPGAGGDFLKGIYNTMGTDK